MEHFTSLFLLLCPQDFKSIGILSVILKKPMFNISLFLLSCRLTVAYRLKLIQLFFIKIKFTNPHILINKIGKFFLYLYLNMSLFTIFFEELILRETLMRTNQSLKIVDLIIYMIGFLLKFIYIKFYANINVIFRYINKFILKRLIIFIFLEKYIKCIINQRFIMDATDKKFVETTKQSKSC